MDYQLRESESISAAFHRIGAEVVVKIRAGVEAADTEGIHEARKGCKWLRAVLRLVRGGMESRATATEFRRIRRVAHLLGNVRDATIRLTSFRSLGLENFKALERRLEKDAAKERNHQLNREGQREIRRAIDTMESGWSELEIKRGDWRHVGRGIERSYRRARKGFHQVDENPTSENIHEWRKRVKDLMYHVRLLRPIKPGRMGKFEKHLDDLSDWLGYDHDLILLTAFLRKDSQLAPTDRRQLFSQVKKHRKEHLTAARHVAESIFQDKPADYVQRLERWWDRWR